MTEFLTTRQLQEILHVDRTTIYRMAEDGRIPAVKVGNQWRYSRRSIEAWLKTQSSVVVTPVETIPASNGIELQQLLPVECVQKIQDAFASLLGVMMVMTDLHGKPVTQVSNPCGLFTLAETSSIARTICQEDWATLANHPSMAPALVNGHLGLEYARGLVRVGSEIKAMLVAGGIAPQEWPPDERSIARIAEYLDVPMAKVQAHINDVFRLSPTDTQQVLTYVQRIADIMAHIMSERNQLFTKLQNIAELTRI